MTAAASGPTPIPLPGRGIMLPAIATLFRLSIERQVRSRRILVVALLFAIPAGLAILGRTYQPERFDPADAERILIFEFLPHALLPLAALLFASGMIQDEVEEQTLTYLLIRPLPKWSIYLGKLLATAMVTAALVALATAAAYVAIRWDDPELTGAVLRSQAPRTAGLLSLAVLTYCAVFGCLGLFVKRALAVGVAYIVVLEGLVANWDFVARRATVMYYVRVLCGRWLGLEPAEWSIDLAEAPDAPTCVLTLAGATLVAAAVAAFAFTVREFRLKTPEGN